MASKVAVSKAPKTYMTHILDQKHFNFDVLWVFGSKTIQTIKMEYCFDEGGYNFQDGVQNGRQLGF